MNQSPPVENPLPKMINVADFAKILGICPRTVWRLVSTGKLPQPVRFGRSVRWRPSDIERCLNGDSDQPSHR
jgi:predicted DNA-binding transcriptional regulator AlpA